MSLWLFNIYMDGCIREMKVRVRDLGARLNVRGVEQPLVAGLYVDDTVLLAESEGMLQWTVDEFGRVCKRRKFKVNAGNSKVMVLERAREQTIDFVKPYRVGSEAILGCKIWLGKEKMEEERERKKYGDEMKLKRKRGNTETEEECCGKTEVREETIRKKGRERQM